TLSNPPTVFHPFPTRRSSDLRSNPVTPDHSEMFTATAFALESVTVTELTAGALSRYQISTRLLIPVRKPTGPFVHAPPESEAELDRKSTRLNSSHDQISYAVF